MSERQPLDDGALRAMLEARADRSARMRPDLREIVAAAGPRAGRPLFRWSVGPRLAWAGGAVAMALVVVMLAAQPLVRQQGGGPTPSDAPSTSGAGSSAAATPFPTTRPALTPLQLLTPAEAGAVITTASATHSGALIAVQGRLETVSTGVCSTTVDVPSQSTTCGPTILADAGVTVTVRPVGDVGPGPWDGSGPLEGALILRLDPRIENDFHVAGFVGLLATPPSGGPAWYVQDLLEGAVNKEGSYAAVQGWLVRDAFHPCPSDPRNPPVSYGCPTDDWLSEDEYQPLRPDGSSLGPSAAIYLSSGSYDRWAPDPVRAGPDGRGVEPREATYLMWLVSDGCGPNADCLPPPPRWRIVGRFDPSTLADQSGPGPSAAPQGDVLSVAELLEQRPSGSADYRVRGWLEASFAAARCAAPVRPTPSGWPHHDCGRFDWLTDTQFSPSPAWESPPVGMLAQSGAYDAFAIDPVWKDQVGEPRFGTYIVRVVLHSTCEALPASSGAACLGGPFWTQEIVGRDDSVANPPGTPASPDPVVATDGRVPPPDGDAWTVAQLRDRPMPGDGTFLVRGWLVATPALRCPEQLPRPSGEPDYGCSEVDWLTDKAFQPWVVNGSGGGTQEPGVGIRVQNGAYADFAPSPAGVDGGGREPRFGTWIVQEVTRGRPCPIGNACPIPTTHWEISARLP